MVYSLYIQEEKLEMRLDSFAAATGSMKSISRKKFSAKPFDYEFTLIPMGKKGVPVVTKLSDDDRYAAVNRISNAEMNYVNDDSIDYHVMTLFSSYANKIGDGEVNSSEEAAQELVDQCTEVYSSME